MSGHRTTAPLIALALALQAALAVIDIVSADDLQFTTTFVLAPFALAVSGRWRPTAAVGVLAVALALASGWWNHFAGSTDHLLRIASVAAGSALATLAAAALERAATQRARMATLAAVGRLTGASTLDEAVSGLAEALVPAAADGCWVDLREPDGATRRLFEHGVEAPGAPRSGPARLLDGGTRALVPLAGLGELGLTTTHGRYSADDLDFFTILAGRVALVLANARLVTDLRSTQARLDGILNSLAEAVTVNDETGRTIFANAAAVRLLGRDDIPGARPGELAARFDITTEDGSPVGLDDLPGRRLLRGEPAGALLTRTIDRVSGRAYWLMTKATLLTDQGRRHAVNIIEDVTEAKDSEQRQRFLARAGALLASSLDVEETLASVARLAVPELADWCAIDMPDDNGGIASVAIAHADPRKVALAEDVRRRFPPDPAGTTGVPGVLKGGPPEHFEAITDALLDAAVEDAEQREALRALGMRSIMIVPMRAGESTLGALTLVTADSGRRFGADDFAFAQDLALRAATAVQNARLFAERSRVAHTLQASLLPEALVPPPGFSAAAGYQAGEHGTAVGGDFYDIAGTGDGRHLVFLGDVTGRGIAAAALTSLVRHSLRTAARFDPRPAAVLQLINDVLADQRTLAPVTLVVLLVEGETVTVAAAGHPPPMLRRGRSVEELGPGGILLGVARGRTFEQRTITLIPGDALLLYTDGVTDRPGAHDRFGAARLAETLADAPDDPEAIVRALETRLADFQSGTAIDDRAILVLRYDGP